MGSGKPFNFQYITQSSTSDITNDINVFEAHYSLGVIVTYFLSTFCTRMKHHHFGGVHYLEFTHVSLIMKRKMTLDRFSFVKTKQRYEIHEFYCFFVYMGFKAQY